MNISESITCGLVIDQGIVRIVHSFILPRLWQQLKRKITRKIIIIIKINLSGDMRAVKSDTDHDLDSEYGIRIDPYIRTTGRDSGLHFGGLHGVGVDGVPAGLPGASVGLRPCNMRTPRGWGAKSREPCGFWGCNVAGDPPVWLGIDHAITTRFLSRQLIKH